MAVIPISPAVAPVILLILLIWWIFRKKKEPEKAPEGRVEPVLQAPPSPPAPPPIPREDRPAG